MILYIIGISVYILIAIIANILEFSKYKQICFKCEYCEIDIVNYSKLCFLHKKHIIDWICNTLFVSIISPVYLFWHICTKFEINTFMDQFIVKDYLEYKKEKEKYENQKIDDKGTYRG